MTRCIPNADKVADEMRQIADNTSLRLLPKDADYIAGILSVVECSKLIDIQELSEKLTFSARAGDVDMFKRAAHKAADKIKTVACDAFEYREV